VPNLRREPGYAELLDALEAVVRAVSGSPAAR
jgi:hypothetical protein